MTYLTEDCTMKDCPTLTCRLEQRLYENTAASKPDTGRIHKEQLKQFEDIYNKNLQKVTMFAYSYLNDMDEAKNIAHDTFIAFWKNKENVNLKDNVLPYLLASAKNLCLNLLRKKDYANKYTQSTHKEKTNLLNTIALENISSIKIYETDVERIISRGMNLMKPKVRHTFLMSRINGLKNREIASVEGIAESTVEARISSALLVMRKLLKDYL